MSLPPASPSPRYRAVSAAAVLSLVLGLLSILLVLGWAFIVIPLASVLLGWRAIKLIGRIREEYTGELLAWTGIVLAGLFTIVGSAWLLLVRVNEVPAGYQRLEYAQLQPDPSAPNDLVPPKAMDFDGKRVFVKGYMVPGRRQVGLRQFRVCPTNGVCTFHFPNPKPTEIIQVTLTGDLVADYTTQLIGVGGRFHVDPDEPHRIPYSMDADYIR